MRATFQIEYFAPEKSSIYIIIGDQKGRPMCYCGGGIWSIECEVAQGESYCYELRSDAGELLRGEDEPAHSIKAYYDGATIIDSWYERTVEKVFCSSLFTAGVFQRNDKSLLYRDFAEGVLLSVEAPMLSPEESLAVLGEKCCLGCWNEQQCVAMSEREGVWSTLLPREAMGSQYKFVVVDQSGRVKYYEEGNNRLLQYGNTRKLIVQGLRLRNYSRRWRGAGVAIPVFSLRSTHDWGCGDFMSLIPMIRWASQVGMSVIQLLPVNDTTSTRTWRDSYPYNAVSSFALHPIYANISDALSLVSQCVDKQTLEAIQSLLAGFADRAATLNNYEAVDYEATIRLKEEALRALYDICGRQVLASDEYSLFYEDSHEWLLPYAVYSSLRDKFSTCDFLQWPQLSQYDAVQAEEYARQHASEVDYYCFVQYILDSQLSRVRDFAHSHRVALKGDIPIGVAPTSVDVWSAPELYNTTMSAGAPPDAFAVDGQNWGFPTYNWSKMAEDDYAWWRRRLEKMARYFDAYRIDHILGFFRIWEVPRNADSAIVGHFNPSLPISEAELAACGLDDVAIYDECNPENDCLFVRYPYSDGVVPRIEGFRTEAFRALDEQQRDAYQKLYEEFFYHRHDDFWRQNAMRRLPRLMSATSMLTCGEDLGMIPACVPDFMAEQQILSLEIERMPKQMGVAFGATEHYPYLSVASTSTHDMSTLREWWQEDRAMTQRYWSEVLSLEGEAEQVCSPATARLIVERHMRSGSILAILPLQDWLAVDEELRRHDFAAERINIPANANHYWRYRMHLNIEELIDADGFNANLSEIISLRKG
ncbi:MAG: 4-alpha-glucanotransferase [Alistipes sp.]|nr:4-alpha-glucanotransferase [Alistipes sp.]